MDLIYTSLDRRPGSFPEYPGESAEITAVLWAHATEPDRLAHVSARSEYDRVDLLFFLQTVDDAAGVLHGSEKQVWFHLNRSYEASPLLQRRFLPPVPSAGMQIIR
ncbi:hypothetical protein ACFYNO_34250 [Kitasatospora sp. NPDC006697]|uniref:hypothetical protein n=1 Tax=Kitasatospora sp. NPDC006697 TaxID=3364020 RepID=UPI00368023A4